MQIDGPQMNDKHLTDLKNKVFGGSEKIEFILTTQSNILNDVQLGNKGRLSL